MSYKLNKDQNLIIELLLKNSSISSKVIFEGVESDKSYATIKREIQKLVDHGLILKEGQLKGTKYSIAPTYQIIKPIDIEEYFKKEIDEREIKDSFNFELIRSGLSNSEIFTNDEKNQLTELQATFIDKTSKLTVAEFQRDLERLAIDLSWKSSQIEGNTYSLLETERLLLEKQTAAGKTRDEATMLLNHKEAIDFMIEHTDYVNPLSMAGIEDIHSILIKDLPVDRNLRKRQVGITGTNYRPLDNEFQIREAIYETCVLINKKSNVFEKALLALCLLSYIQAFNDGNKRTARIICNGILISEKHCPLSFRTVDSIDFKKAMLLFYEQNNLSAVKSIFIEQYSFAVNTYF